MMEKTPLVSVVIPAYNSERYLEEALASVFLQTYAPYEVIVVDDGSTTKGVARVCGRYQKMLKYIWQENKGLSGARNTGILNSGGEYLAFLDSDDSWLPEKLKKQVRYYEELNVRGVLAGLVYTGVQECCEDGSFLYNFLWKSAGPSYEKLLLADFIAYGGSSVMVKRCVLDDVGLFDEALRCAEDYDLWLRIAKKYPLYSINECLVKFRNTRGSLSKNPEKMIRAKELILEKVFRDEALTQRLGSVSKEKIIKSHHWYSALRWKNAAYEHLFGALDGKTFREYIRKGRALDRSLFGSKVFVYYLLSYLSPVFCRMLKKLKKEPHRDILMDIKDLNVERTHDWAR